MQPIATNDIDARMYFCMNMNMSAMTKEEKVPMIHKVKRKFMILFMRLILASSLASRAVTHWHCPASGRINPQWWQIAMLSSSSQGMIPILSIDLRAVAFIVIPHLLRLLPGCVRPSGDLFFVYITSASITAGSRPRARMYLRRVRGIAGHFLFFSARKTVSTDTPAFVARASWVRPRSTR